MTPAGLLAVPLQKLGSVGGFAPELVLSLVGTLLLLAVILPALYLYWRKKRNLKRSFFSKGRELGLKEEELSLLWRYLLKLPVNPLSLFESRALFERVASSVAKKGSEEEIKLLPSLRKKLRFENLPWFIPIKSTKDLDLYQTGLLMTEKERSEAFLKDKDEEHLTVVPFKEVKLREGEKVKFFFVREDDARYHAEGTVKETRREENKSVVVIKTEELKRVQLREVIRWKVNLKAFFTKGSGERYEGTVEDISVKGLRLCTSPETPLEEGERIALTFTLKNTPFQGVIGKVIYVKEIEGRKCAGIEFAELSPEEKKAIEAFIKEEQSKLAKLYRSGEKDEQ